MTEATLSVASETQWRRAEIDSFVEAVRAQDGNGCKAVLEPKGLRSFCPAGTLDSRSGIVILSAGRSDDCVESFIAGMMRFVNGFVLNKSAALPGNNMELRVHVFPPGAVDGSGCIKIDVCKTPRVNRESLPAARTDAQVPARK